MKCKVGEEVKAKVKAILTAIDWKYKKGEILIRMGPKQFVTFIVDFKDLEPIEGK